MFFQTAELRRGRVRVDRRIDAVLARYSWACNMSMTSSPRVSPTIIRSGRIPQRVAQQSRWVTAPLPHVRRTLPSGPHGPAEAEVLPLSSKVVQARLVLPRSWTKR